MGLLYRFPRLYDVLVDSVLALERGLPEPDRFFELVAGAETRAGATVLDLACGSGFAALRIGARRPDVQVLGVDLAPDLIDRARAEADARGLRNVRLHLGPVQSLDQPVDVVCCAFGFSAFGPHAEAIYRHAHALLEPGGHFVVMDAEYAQRTWSARLAARLFDRPLLGADHFSAVWPWLEHDCDAFEMQAGDFRILGVLPRLRVYVARGRKR